MIPFFIIALHAENGAYWVGVRNPDLLELYCCGDLNVQIYYFVLVPGGALKRMVSEGASRARDRGFVIGWNWDYGLCRAAKCCRE